MIPLIRRTYFGLLDIYNFIKTEVNKDRETLLVSPIEVLNAYATSHSGALIDNGIFWDFDSNLFASAFEDIFKYLLNNHRDDYFYFLDSKYYEDYPVLDDDICFDAIIRLVAEYQATQDKYLVLLNYYGTNKNNLLNVVKQEQIHQYNDTPQNYGDYSSESHMSSYDKMTINNDFDTLMARLAEVQSKFRNLVKDWANEFKSLFYIA